jgi:hypothetical protein
VQKLMSESGFTGLKDLPDYLLNPLNPDSDSLSIINNSPAGANIQQLIFNT